jgi:hypothetical protein
MTGGQIHIKFIIMYQQKKKSKVQLKNMKLDENKKQMLDGLKKLLLTPVLQIYLQLKKIIKATML